MKVSILRRGDAGVLARVARGVFDEPIDPRRSARFLADPRHHIVVAIDGGWVVGFASAVHYVNPDKPPELWINEVGVAKSHRRRGCGKRMLRALLGVARRLGCAEAWVLTDESNKPARRLYRAAGGVRKRRPAVMYEFFLHPKRKRR